MSRLPRLDVEDGSEDPSASRVAGAAAAPLAEAGRALGGFAASLMLTLPSALGS